MNPDAVFLEHRPLLLGIAYRMLGSVHDAEDLLQEAWLRWQSVRHEDVASPRSYLATMTTRLAIDSMRSAQSRREQYFGEWLPEPVAAGAQIAGDTGSLRMGMLRLLERLNAIERAVFLLRESFDYAYSEIADVVGKTEANCRQLHARARRHVSESKARFQPAPGKQATLMTQFLTAIQSGDLPGLEKWLARDIVLTSDGGGKAVAAVQPIYGAERVAKFFLGLQAKAPADALYALTQFNNAPALTVTYGGKLQTVLVCEYTDEQIGSIYVVRNPDKLTHLEGIHVH